MIDWNILAVFVVSVAIMSWSSVHLATSLERIGRRLKLSDGLLGIVTALGADAPEISSAFTALLSNHHEVGLGVVIGSNIFNLAGLLGLSALVAGRVTMGRQGLWLNGGASLIVSIILLALVLQWISVSASLVLLILVLVPYLALMALQSTRIDTFRLPFQIGRFFSIAVGHAHHDARKRDIIPLATHKDVLWTVFSLVLIILSSYSAVHSVVLLGHSLGISHAVLGMFILAALTSLPNVIAAIHLAREGRSSAVISESLNSNTLNILAGICLPAILIGFAPPSNTIIYATFWLICMKLLALIFASGRQGINRINGIIIIAMYFVFIIAVILV